MKRARPSSLPEGGGTAPQGDLFGADGLGGRPPAHAPGPRPNVPASIEAPREAPLVSAKPPDPAPPELVVAASAAGLARPSVPHAPPASPELRPWQPRPTAAGPAGAPAERPVWTVGALTRAIKDTLERGFARVLVKGEVTGFRGPNARGHLYFSLKDSEACIDTKVWASLAQKLKFKLREGMCVLAEGYVDLFAPQGRYSLIVNRLEPVGEGALAIAFAQLKERLSAEGLMGDQRRRPPRPLPFLPRRIGVVTSRTGAALQDFLRVLHGRHPHLAVLVCDARVQGEGSAEEVVRALARLSRTDVDVIVVTRGGGSVEDLWTFNEESVARAIHACPVPVVSAIGHEVDFTIADFVADFRAPTPSAAAERLAPVLRELMLGLATAESRCIKGVQHQLLDARHRLRQLQGALPDPRRRLGQAELVVDELSQRLARRMRQLLRLRREQLKSLQLRVDRQQPRARLAARRQALLLLRDRLVAAARAALRTRREALERLRRELVERQSPGRRLPRERERLAQLDRRAHERLRRMLADAHARFHQQAGRLEAMSPLKVMSRGYAVAFRQRDGHLVRSSADVAVGDVLALKLAARSAGTLEDCEQIDVQVTGLPGPTS